ncbi:MAG: hypothetical protein HIU84_07940 [Acidobacteria bacterium]|nr:hypothetical protein [Acidobacteriota bacterium]
MEYRATLVTKHAKQTVIGPIFAQFGWILDTAWADTDQLGTFSGDVPRPYSPLETARQKALLGAAMTGAPWLVASEGTVQSSFFGLVEDLEIVALVEREGARMVVGRSIGMNIRAVKFRVDASTSEDEIIRRCADADLPRHRLLVALEDHSASSVGALDSAQSVLDVCRDFLRRDKTLVIQTDLRAHLCPSRREIIADAATDLMVRMKQHCPKCGEPGFGEEGTVPGMPCCACGLPTDETRARRWSCSACAHFEDRPVAGADTDPARCQWCNP